MCYVRISNCPSCGSPQRCVPFDCDKVRLGLQEKTCADFRRLEVADLDACAFCRTRGPRRHRGSNRPRTAADKLLFLVGQVASKAKRLGSEAKMEWRALVHENSELRQRIRGGLNGRRTRRVYGRAKWS